MVRRMMSLAASRCVMRSSTWLESVHCLLGKRDPVGVSSQQNMTVPLWVSGFSPTDLAFLIVSAEGTAGVSDAAACAAGVDAGTVGVVALALGAVAAGGVLGAGAAGCCA
jgi:hypothetical protein